MHEYLLADIGIAIVGAAAVAFPAYLLKIPLLLAYLAAGVILGPHLGFGFIKSAESISTLSEIGLVLLMFILGLEIDLKKLLQSGKAVMINGVTQFVGCVLFGLFFSWYFGAEENMGRYGRMYLAVACSLSSTLIVVKILSDKMALGTLPSRITLGILVIQDLWAIAFLAVQPSLSELSFLAILFSVSKAAVLVTISWFFARFLLPKIFEKAGKQPELMLIVALSWCFAFCGFANYLKLSLEMGALVAGVSIASFPYHLDIAAKLSSLRDFFITLFFVALGLQIPMPNKNIVFVSAFIIIFVLLSRIILVFPVLRLLNYGNRASLLPAVNLSQVSEFSLVLTALGVSYGHVNQDLVSAFIISMVVTSLVSSFLIPHGHEIYRILNPLLEKMGIKDHVGTDREHDDQKVQNEKVVLLGFFREASSLLTEIVTRHSNTALKELMVVDFNPEAHLKLKEMGIACKYGDIGNADTLRHLNLEKAKILICTISDQSLKGTDNLTLLRSLRKISPEAKIIVTAETISSAIEMYEGGAEYVFIPRLISANYLADVIERIQTNDAVNLKQNAVEHLRSLNEVIP